MTLPMAVLVSTLYAFSRLAAENEVTAFKASGVSMSRLLGPVLWGATGMAALMIVFNDQVLPRANHRLRVLQSDIARKKPTFALREQVINEVSPGKLSIRTNHLDESTNLMREVTIYDLGDPTNRRTIHADSGTLAVAADRKDLQLVLFDGDIQEMPRAQPGQLQRIFFHQNTVRIKDVFNSLDRSEDDTYKSDREMSVCEMEQQVRSALLEEAQARHDLRETLVAAVHKAGTGVDRRRAPYPKVTPDRWSIGALYCAAVTALGVKEAEAAEVTAAAQGPLTGRAAGKARARADSVRAAREREQMAAESLTAVRGAAHPPTLGQAYEARSAAIIPAVPLANIVGAIEASQTRIEDSAQSSDGYAVEIEKKFALSAACVVFVLLGAPVALRFPRGGVGLTIGVSLGVFALYYVGLIGGEELANRDLLSPFWAMWATNVLFTAIGLVLLSRMGKEGSTARGGDMGEVMDKLRTWVRRRTGRERRHAAPVEAT
jgi:lipopolysaccharide export system permease protein